MNDNLNPIWETIDKDQEMISGSRRLLSEHGLMGLYESVPGLFSSMMREAEQNSRERSDLLRIGEDGKEHLNWDCVLRILLAQSASMQFLYAMGHLLRGHMMEVYGHLRMMIECAGVAYLSREHPDFKLGELYRDDERGYRKHTRKEKLFPQKQKKKGLIDPMADLRAVLGSSYDLTSWMFHSNFVSIVGRVNLELKHDEGTLVTFMNTMIFHDAATVDKPTYLQHAGFLATDTYRVLWLFAGAFDIPDGIWRRRLDGYDRKMKPLLKKIVALSKAKRSLVEN